MNACCNGWSVPSAFSKPSMVVTFLPRASYAKYVQALTGAPSINTVQAPQTWTSQETLVPFKLSVLRRTSARVSAGSQSTSLALPLSWNESFISNNNWSGGILECWVFLNPLLHHTTPPTTLLQLYRGRIFSAQSS